MTKFQVTKELSTLLKLMRTQNHISAKDLSMYIGKSISYVSKLENHQIKTIQEEELTRILTFITTGNDFFEDKYPAIIQLLASFIEPEHITEQIWLLHYEAFLRPIFLPEEVIHDFKERLLQLHTTPLDFIERINSCDDFKYLKKLPPNQVIETSYNGKKSIFIHFFIDWKKFSDLLEHETVRICQSDLFRIVFQLFREELFNGVAINDKNENIILNHTVAYLEQYNLWPLIYQRFLPSPQELHFSLLTMKQGYASTTSQQIAEKLSHLQDAISDADLGTIAVMDTLQKNIDWDPAFTLKILDIPFHELDSTSFHYKKELLNDITSLFEKYKNLPEMEKKFEIY